MLFLVSGRVRGVNDSCESVGEVRERVSAPVDDGDGDEDDVEDELVDELASETGAIGCVEMNGSFRAYRRLGGLACVYICPFRPSVFCVEPSE